MGGTGHSPNGGYRAQPRSSFRKVPVPWYIFLSVNILCTHVCQCMCQCGGPDYSTDHCDSSQSTPSAVLFLDSQAHH